MQVADHILIPLLDGRNALAQVVQVYENRAAIHLTIHPYGDDRRTFSVAAKDVLAVLAVDLSTLPKDHWPIIGYEAIPDLNHTPQDLAADDTVLHDPAIVDAFANAIHGLYPWDGFPDPAFFTNLLRTPDTLPPHAKLQATFPKRDGS